MSFKSRLIALYGVLIAANVAVAAWAFVLFAGDSVKLGTGSHEARIVSNQWLGDQSHLALDVAGKLLVAVSHTPIAAKLGTKLNYQIGVANLHVFDAETGTALSHGMEAA